MKFSDMMGDDENGTDVETDAPPLPPLPPTTRSAAPLPEAPVRLGGNRSEPDDSAAGSATPTEETTAAQTPARAAPTADPPDAALAAMTPTAAPADPLMSDVVAELAPRPGVAARSTGTASDDQLDATAWLEDLGSIDDDLLPH